MLKYLLKYDLKRMLKWLLWLYGISIGLSGITRIINIWNDIQIISLVGSLFSGLAYIAIAGVLISTFILILITFLNNFYKDQSYFTHTLPTTKNSLLLSKYLASLIVVFGSLIVAILSLFILLYSPEFVQTIQAILLSIDMEFGISGGLFVALTLLVMIAETCSLISMAFTAIVKGNTFNQGRGSKGFAWFLIYYVICMYFNSIVIVLAMLVSGNIQNLFSNQLSGSALLVIMIAGLVAYILCAVIFYFVCKKIFNKGVNVD